MCGARSAHVTGVAEEMRVQREALRAGLIRELFTTLLGGEGRDKKRQIRTGMHTEEVRSGNLALMIAHLTVVALKVVVLVHRHHAQDLFTVLRHKI